MGEVSHAKPAGVTKPRPLGYVKRESVHFGEEDGRGSSPFLDSSQQAGDSRPSLHDSFIFQRSRTDGDFRNELKSMRDLQETLRQAALLNIVAAVNHDGKTTGGSSNMPSSSRQGVPPAGIKGDNILRHSLPEGSKLVLSHGNSSDHQTGGAFSRHLHTTTTAGTQPNTPAAPPNTALNRLLLERTRTISIPRPRTHDQQQQQSSTFIHSSLVDAKEHLATMTNFRARTKHDSSINAAAAAISFPGVLTTETSVMDKMDPYTSMTSRGDVTREFPSYGLAVEGGVMGKSGSTHHQDANNAAANKTADPNANVSKMSKEEQRAHNVYQMQMLKRHISTTKKRDLVKKLTEMARCEAVDMNQVVDVPSGAKHPAAPGTAGGGAGMIILAQNKSHSHADAADTPDIPGTASILKRPSSLHEKKDTNLRVPSNSRVQSETIEAMMSHREKRGASVVPDDDLRIDGGGVASRAADLGDHGGDFRGAMSHYHGGENDGDANDFHLWLKDQKLTGYASRPHPYSSTPEVLELRPLAASPLHHSHKDKRKVLISRRGLNPVLRDKVLSPSPVVYEATFHKPKASIRHISLVGQSLPSIPTSKLASFSDKTSPSHHHQQPQQQQPTDDQTSPSRAKKGGDDAEQAKLWNDNWHLSDKPTNRVLKPWGSTVRQTMQDSPILRTEILDHLQCVGIVDRRTPMQKEKTVLSYKVNGVNKIHVDDNHSSDRDSDDEEDVAAAQSALYRKSKLYSAFRASEENLAHFAENSSMVSDTLTARSLLSGQPGGRGVAGKMEPSLPPPPPSRDSTMMHQRDPLNPAQPSEPRYMGSSSRVSDNEMRSQFHFINDQEEAEAKKGGDFRVFKALDQDVYYDFQHKKYRGSSTASSNLNTAANKPRMHFIKIKYNGEVKS